MIKVDVNMIMKLSSSEGMTPLGALCGRNSFSAMIDMVVCLVEEDRSASVIVNAISCCIKGHFKLTETSMITP